MYDGESMKNFIQENSPFKCQILPAGYTNIKESTCINLYERYGDSVYLEAVK